MPTVPDAANALAGRLALASALSSPAGASPLLSRCNPSPACSGTVVRCGPGKQDDDGERKAPKVNPGDRVIYFKYAGDSMETPEGERYNVLHEQDILAKL